jgi:hypothetical protein
VTDELTSLPYWFEEMVIVADKLGLPVGIK